MRKLNKKRLAGVSGIAAVLFIAPLIVFAMLYKSDVRENKFKPANDNVQIGENGQDPADTQDNSYTWEPVTNSGNEITGYSADKTVFFKNGKNSITDTRNNNDEYLRVRFVPMWYDGEGNICVIDGVSDYSTVSLNSEVQENATALVYSTISGAPTLTLRLSQKWHENWTFNAAEQCFYYKGLLRSDKTTDPLIAKAEITKAVYDQAEGYSMQIDVLADAIQKTDGDQRWNATP